ncbi:MAG TPA: TIGR02444 family protein [Bradyrhizobium sp.]|nr:TIGR02444 family protein [Bradyrhizobium sp.]
MAPSRTEIEAESWAFALAIYARPGVAPACLTLQNEAGVDVMLLLMASFAAVRLRILLSQDEIAALDEACRPWRERIVWPLRTIRSELKMGPKPAPNGDTEQFRSKVKAVELAAEKLQNQLLAECLPLRPPGINAVTSEQLRVVLDRLVSLFREKRDEKPAVNLSPPIATIVEAAMQDTS